MFAILPTGYAFVSIYYFFKDCKFRQRSNSLKVEL